MTRSASPVVSFAAFLFVGTLAAQDVLYYKFDELGGTKVVNYAAGSAVAPAEGTLLGGGNPKFQPGKFGLGALAGGTSTSSTVTSLVDSGWLPNLSNRDFTIAFFIKQRTAPASTSYFCYTNGGMRMFTGGVASKGLYFRNGSSGTDEDWILTTDIQSPAATAWVHIAMVADATALSVTYYMNGVQQSSVPIKSGANAAGGTYSFRAGGFTTYGGVYDIDEFRVSLRAVSAPEILAWATRTAPADGAYGKACNGAALTSSNGPPKLGGFLYALHVSGNTGGVFALGFGSNRLSLGAIPLPLDLGLVFPSLKGCGWETSGDVLFVGGALAGGTARVPLPIPNVPAWDGIALWAQAVVLGPSSDQMTNAFSISLGQ